MRNWLCINLVTNDTTPVTMTDRRMQELRNAWTSGGMWRMLVDLPDLLIATWEGDAVHAASRLNIFICWRTP